MTESLTAVARESDATVREARARLTRAIRQAAAEGMTQEEIARAIGRSQPEVSRLLRFRGDSPLGARVRAARAEIVEMVRRAGGSRVRVFGSVATGDDDAESDIDLVFTMREPLSLLELGTLESQISALVGADVDLVPESALRPDLRERVLAEAVAL